MKDGHALCPLCGHDAPSIGVHVSLEADVAMIDGHVLRLGPAEASVLYTLAAQQYRFVPAVELYSAAYGGQQPEAETLHHLIRRLRSKIDATTWQIRSKNRPGVKEAPGYMLCRSEMNIPSEKLAAAASALAEIGMTDEDIDAALGMAGQAVPQT